MGTCWDLYNFTRKERTDIGVYQVNSKNWMESPLSNFYFYMKNHYWNVNDDIQLVGDTSGSYDFLIEEFNNITEKAVKEYNEIATNHYEYYRDEDIPIIKS